jgi:hypothetical protein
MTAGSRRDAGVREGMSPPHESVRGIDPWYYEVNLPDVDPVFRSSCCGNSYCRKWSKTVMVIFPKNCIPIRLRCGVALSMIRKGLNKYDTHQFVVFK